MIFFHVVASLLFLCWGSFLNVVGYRIIRGYSFTGRSNCPHCKCQLAWYDTIPVVSYMLIQGRCRQCNNIISPLYPFIELLTALLLMFLIVYISVTYWFGYGVFISACIVTIRTDFEKMLISRYLTWGFIPIAFILSALQYIPLTINESIQGSMFGFAILWIVSQLFYMFKNKEGLGEGDIDFLAMIGSFTGIAGAWTALLLGSFFGIIAYCAQIAFSKRTHAKIAFGPWLAMGAIVYIFFQDLILTFFDPLLM